MLDVEYIKNHACDIAHDWTCEEEIINAINACSTQEDLYKVSKQVYCISSYHVTDFIARELRRGKV